MLGEKLPEHRGVLVGDRGAVLRQHAGRQVERRRDRIEVPGAGAGAGPDQHLMGLARGDDLVDQRVDRGPAAVDHALPADLDHRRVGEDAEVRRRLGRRQKLGIVQRSLHQQRLERRRRLGHKTLH